MGKLKLTITGTDQIARKLRALASHTPESIVIGMYALAERIAADAVRRTPVDTGRLRSSGYVAPPSQTGNKNKLEIGFGTDYAVAVHERTDVTHEVGEAKFLEKAVMAKAKGSLSFIAKHAQRFVEKGGQPKSGKFPKRPSE